jgi:Zn-dependent M28 family amino/carboxypeptidase
MTAENAKARAFLAGELRRLGVDQVNGRYEHAFSMPRRNRPDSVHGVNVLGMVRGNEFPDRVIVVSAHFDHVAPRNGQIYNGADDNASGTATLLQLAAHFRRNAPRHTLVFAFFDAEEMGLLGARAFVTNPPMPLAQIAANVNMDMVARGDNGILWAVGTTPWPQMKPIVESLVPVAPVTLKMGFDTGTGRDNWTSLSDQGAFHAQGIPFVYFGVEDHADYHEPTDDPEKVNPAWFYASARTVAAFVTRLDAAVAGWPAR